MTDIKATNFNVEDEVTLSDYPSVNIQGLPYGKIKLSHPILIVWIIRDTQLEQGHGGYRPQYHEVKIKIHVNISSMPFILDIKNPDGHCTFKLKIILCQSIVFINRDCTVNVHHQ